MPAWTNGFAMGDSLVAAAHLADPSLGFFAGLCADLGIPGTNDAVGGTMVPDVAWHAHRRDYTAANLVIYGTNPNDVNWFGGPAAAAKRFLAAEGHLATILQLGTPVGAHKIRGRSMGIAGTGSWSNLIDDQDIGGVYTQTPGAARTCTMGGSTIVSNIWTYDAMGGQISVLIDGVERGPFSANNLTISGSSDGRIASSIEGHFMGPMSLIFDGLSDTLHDVRIGKADSSSGLISISSVMGFNGSPVDGAAVLAGNGTERLPVSWATVGDGGGQQRLPLYNRAWARNVAIANRLGLHRVRLADWHAIIDPAVDTPPDDGLHWNAGGHLKVRNDMFALASLVRAGLERPVPPDLLKCGYIARRGFGPRYDCALSFQNEQLSL